MGGMECSPAELHALSTRLLAHSVELRCAAGFARKRGSDCRESAQAARSRAETCRIHAEAAVSVLRIQPPRPSRLPSANSQWASTAQPDRPLVAFRSEEYRTEPRRMPSLQPHVVSEAVTSVGVEMPSRHADRDVAARLQELYHKNDIARAVFDDAAERRYVVAKTSVDRIARIAGTTRAKAGDLCMLLDVIGVATFKQAKRPAITNSPPEFTGAMLRAALVSFRRAQRTRCRILSWTKPVGSPRTRSPRMVPTTLRQIVSLSTNSPCARVGFRPCACR